MNQDFLAKMSNGDKAIAAGSVVVLVSLFLPWYGWDAGVFGSASVDGFNSWGILTLIALVAVVAFWVIRAYLADSVKLPDMPVTDDQAYMIGGAVEALGAVLFWLVYHNDNLGLANLGVRYGIFIALVGGVVTAYGGYLKQSEPAPAPPPPPPVPTA